MRDPPQSLARTMAASLQHRAFHVLVLALVLTLSSLLAVHVEARPPPDNEEKTGSLSIKNELNVVLDVQCDSGFRHQNVGTLPAGTGYGGFEFPIVNQNYWKCTLSAPAAPGSPALSGTFTLWARIKSFSPGHFVYWLVNRDGLYLVPHINRGITPGDGTLVYHWPQ